MEKSEEIGFYSQEYFRSIRYLTEYRSVSPKLDELRTRSHPG
jgi:hypothetical protein